MSINICKDIELLKNEFCKINIAKYDSLNAECISEDSSFNSALDNLYELLESLEGINNDVIKNKNLLKNVLQEDYDVKKKCIEKIKNMINKYVNFYDYVDDIRLSFENLKNSKNSDMSKVINDILEFLEKEFLKIGITVYKPIIGIDKFDKCKHEVIKTEKNPKLPDGTIIYIEKKGFYYNDRNIRYIRTSKVITILN